MSIDALNAGIEYLVSEVARYTEAQLSIEPEHAELLAFCRAENAALVEAADEVARAKGDLVVARAHRDRHQYKVRIAAGAFAAKLHQLSGGNRKSDVYVAYFPEGYGAFGRLSLAGQMDHARALLVRLDAEPNEDVKAAGEGFRAVVAAAEPIQAEYDAKLQVLIGAKSRLYAARIRWRAAFRKLGADLRSMHTDDPRYVSSFFLAPSRRRRNGKSGDDGSGSGDADGDAAVAVSGNGNGQANVQTNGQSNGQASAESNGSANGVAAAQTVTVV
ncbi:MAG: hypothetical protein H6682_08280 [Candidatus Eisenbacteria bacterium]|nr:hypothetical protein [Candidatus Eisenbacteria bacterium]